MASDDEDVPDSGAVFTFGRSRFLDNKFWIRDDAVIHLACGDEHSAVVTENGKLYTFGNNDWGQLGHGNTVQFPSPKLVKRLKPEKVKLVAAGRHHTIVSTESGKLYSFGCGSDGQLGHGDCENLTIPKAIESLPDQQYRMLDGGSDFTAAVTAEGQLYTWGSSAEGQTGQGDEDWEEPTKVQLRGKVVAVACGYYHMAVATDDGTLYTCGENESGKLGLDESQLRDTKRLQKLFINEQVTAVACGGNHTAVVTASGKLFAFGQGDHGELGHGSSWLECPSPKQVTCLRNIHVKFVACGESHTAVITKHGNLYTCGDGRHGKLGMGEESFSNLFKLEKVKRFDDFTVQKAACGGCHTLVTAFKTSEIHEGTDSEAEAEKDILAASISSTKSLQDAVDGRSGYMSGLAATVPVGGAARNKRRQRNIENLGNSIGGSLPPINKSTLPPLSRTLPVLKKEPAKEEKIPVNPLDMSTLPKILQEDEGSDKRKDEVKKEKKSAVKKETKVTKRIKKPKDAESSSGISESEEDDEEDDEEEQDNKNKDKTTVTKEEQKKADEKSEESMTEDESDSEEEGSTGKNKIEELNKSGKATTTITSNKDDKKSKVPPKKEEDEEEEEDSGEEEESDDDEESAEEGRKPDKNKQLTVVGKKIDVTKVERRKDKDEESEEEESDGDEEEDDDDDDEEEGEVNKKKKQEKESEKTSEAKEKDKKPDNKKKKETEEEEESEEDEEEEEDEDEEEEESEADEKTKDAEKDKQAKEKTEAKKKKKKTDENEEEEEQEDDSGKKKAGNKKDKKKNKKEKDKVSEKEVDDEAEANEDDKTEDDKADKEEETTKDKKDKKEDAAGKPEAGKKEKKSGICVLL